MPPAESLTLIERYGSFGLVAVIVLAGIAGIVVFLRYLQGDLIPRAFAFLEKKDAEHAAERKVEREATLATLQKIGERLDRIEDRLEDAATRQPKRGSHV